MIATFLAGKTGTVDRSSASCSELLGPSHLIAANSPRPVGLNIDGGVGLSTNRRSGLPVVMFPAMREYGGVLQRAADDLFKLQQASLEFRVVALTDTGNFKSIRPFGWVLAHIPAEESWDVPDLRWDAYFKSEVIRAVEDFGVTDWVHLGPEGILEESWQQLTSIAKLPIERHVETYLCPPVPSTLHYSWRGWLSAVPEGFSRHEVLLESDEWTIEIDRKPRSSIVLVHVGESTPEFRDLQRQASEQSWNIVRMFHLNGPGDHAVEDLGVKAMFDAYSFSNAGILSKVRGGDRPIGTTPTAQLTRWRSDETAVNEAERRALAYWSSP